MSVVWHRLGNEHPLVQELDRISRAQCRNLHARQRARRSGDSNSDVRRELAAERDQLAMIRAAREVSVQNALAKAKRWSPALTAARMHLANALSQGSKPHIRARDSSVG